MSKANTYEEIRAAFLAVPGVVLVAFSQRWLYGITVHVRGGSSADIADVGKLVAQIKPVHVALDIEHAEPQPHHYVLQENPWLVPTRSLKIS